MIATKRWMRWLLLVASVLAINAQSAPRPVDDYDDLDVILAGRYPTVAWVAPANNSVYVAPISASSAISLRATAGSRKFTITKLEFVYRKDCVSCAETALPVAALQTGTNKSGLYQYVWNNAVVGSYLIRAKVTDSGGGVSFAGPVTINVDTAPTVAITSPATNTVVTAPASFALTTNAADPDAGGGISKVEFYKSATVFDASTIIGTVTVAPWNFTWSNVAAGTYTVVARATDNLGVTFTSAPITLISNASPTVTLSSPTNNATYTAPATVSLSATATDSDGTIGNVTFYKSATLFDTSTLIGTVSTGVAGVFSTNWATVPVGSYAVTARATDNRGAIVASGSANITVCGAPTVSLTSPTPGQQIDVVSGGNTPVSLSATTSTLPASCGTISKIEYYNSNTLVATSTTSPFSTTWNAVVAGSYSIKARAYVGTATTGTDSVASSLIVNNKPTVTMSQPTTNTFVAAPATIAFAATAADVGGTINRVEFLNGASVVNSDTTSPYAYSWTGVTAGVYSLSARAVDNLNASTTSTAATVTVCAAPTVALNQPTNGQVVTVANQTATATVALAVTVTTPYVDCIGKVEYYNGTTLIATATAAPWSANWTGVATATYAIKARVYTIGSTTSYTESAPATLYVNKPPVVTLTTPSTTQVGLTAPSNITLSATATDTDPNVQSVAFYNGTTLIGTINTGQAAANGQPAQSGSIYNYVWTPSVGNFSISAIATDGRLATAQTAANALSVCGTPTISLTTSTAQPIVLPANSGVLNATVTQPNTNAKCGTITQVDFYRTGTTPAINTDTTAPYSYTVSGLVAGTTNYTAKVTDSAGRTASTATSVPLTVVNNIQPTVYISTPATATNITYSPTTAYTVTAKANDTDNGISSIQLRNNGVNLDSTPLVTTDGTACTFTPVTPGLERICSAAIPAGTPVGTQSITAVANDGTTSVTSAAVDVTIQPAPIACTLIAITPISGTTTTVSANCKSGGSNLAGVTIAWTGTCTTSTTTTDASGNASCSTPALTAPTSYAYSINATKANYSAVSTNISITPITNVAPKIAITGTSIVAGQVVVNTQSSDAQTLTLTGQLSNGTVLTNNNGVLSGIVPTTAGIYTMTVTANDGFSTTTAQSTVAVQAAAAADDVGAGAATNVTVGTIGGSFGVAEGGAATYGIPIQVPPGTNGVQPSLSLAYSSQGGYGMLGVGWSLSGLGAITRCPKNIDQDGYREAINYDDRWDNDEYCYGGQRLIRIGGRVGAGTATSTLQYTDKTPPYAVHSFTSTESASKQIFGTEIDTYSRITGFFSDPINGQVKDGVSRFEVETKDGRVLHFGRRWKPLSNGFELCPAPLDPTSCRRAQTGNLVKMYVLDRVEDRAGNTMEIDYAGSNVVDWVTLQAPAQNATLAIASQAAPSYPPTEIYPTQIRYTSNATVGTAASATINFNYAPLDAGAQVRAFDSGAGESITTQKLVSIDTYDGATLRKQYRFGYVSGGSASSGRALLQKVTECFDTGAESTSCLSPTNLEWQGAFFSGLNGPDSGAFLTGFTGNYDDFKFDQKDMVADVKGTGRSQWARVGWAGGSKFRVFLCEMGATGSACESQYVDMQMASTSTKKAFFWADVNGDGRADLIGREFTASGNDFLGVFVTCLSNSNGTGFSTNEFQPTTCTKVTVGNGSNDIIYGDFNGDGKIDFGFIRPADTLTNKTQIEFRFGAGDGTFPTTSTQTIVGSVDSLIGSNNAFTPPLSRFVVADFNGDGLADVAEKFVGDRWRICMSRIAPSGAWYLDCPQDGQEVLAGTGTTTPLPYMGQKMVCSAPASMLGAGASIALNLSVTGSGDPSGANVPIVLSSNVPNFGPGCTLALDSTITASASTNACQNGPTGTMQLSVTSTMTDAILRQLTDSASVSVFHVNYSLTLSNTSSTVAVPAGAVVTWETILPTSAGYGYSIFDDLRNAVGFTAPSGVVCNRQDVRTVVGVSGKLGTQILTVDVNGDGLADLMAPVDENNVENPASPNFGKWNVCLSTGDGAFARFKSTGQAQSTCSTHTLVKAKMDKILVGDFNGDGRSDILAWNDYDVLGYPGETGWKLCLAKGADASNTASESSVAFDCSKTFSWLRPNMTPVRDHVKTGDFNGDGFTDVSFERFAGGYQIQVGTPGGVTADLITKVTTGLGATTSVAYSPLTSAAVYDKGDVLSALGPKELHIQSPMQVVREVQADNGVGGKFVTRYFYKGLKGTTSGRGMLGFSERLAYDVTGEFFTSTLYNNSLANWQLAGRAAQVSKYYQSAAMTTPLLLNRTTTSYHPVAVPPVGQPKIYQVFGYQTKTQAWDLVRNAANGTLTTVALPSTTSTTELVDYLAYGNVKKTTSTTGDGATTYTKITENTYLNQDTPATANTLGRGDWIIGRVLTAKATHQQTGSTDVVRNSSFTYYGIDASCTGAPKGYLCEETLEPSLENTATPQVIDGTARADLPSYLLWQKTKYTYDAFGNRTSATISYKDGANNLLTRSSGASSFDATGRFATLVSNALLHTETRTFDGAFGNVLTTTSPNGFLTESTYDAFGRKLRERSFGGSANTDPVVSDASWLNQSCGESDSVYGTAAICVGNEIYRARKRVSAGPATIVFYDKLQRELRAKTQEFNGGWTESSVTFDAKGRKAATTRPAGAGTLTTTYDYDELNRVVTETLTTSGASPQSHITKTTFNGLTTIVTQQAGATPSATLDQSMTRVVNSQGQVISSTDALANLTSFSYDAVGNLVQVSTAGGVTEIMGYDGRGRKVKLVSPSAGTFSYTPNGLGELVKQTDGRGWESVMYYDTLGRLYQRREFEGTVASSANPFLTTWNYDGACAPNGTDGLPKSRGKLCSVATTKNGAANTQQSTTYDALGRAVQTLTQLDRSTAATADGKDGPRSFISTAQFDANSRVERIGYPGGVVLRNNYKAWGGGLQSVTDNTGTTTHWTATSRYLDGQLQTMTVGGQTTTKGYDVFGRIDTINTANGAVQDLNVDFDRFGNLINRVDTAAGNILQSESFGYDKLNRLTTRNGQTAVTYDAIGNIQSLTGSGYGGMSTATSTYLYDTAPGGCKRLLSVTGAQTRSMGSCTSGYDGNGNLLSDGLRSMQYTAWNLPKSISKGGNTLAYDYDHSHARVKEVSTQHGSTYYVGGYELVIPVSATAAQNQTEERNYIATPEGSVGVITQKTSANASGAATESTDTAYWHKDHLGSLVAITSGNAGTFGQVTQRFRFDPWGNRDCLLPSGGTTPCSSSNTGGANGTGSEERGFTGHEMLDEVGLIHMNGRLFDPAIGRFTQADPIIQEPLNSQNYNRYSYVLNNPLVYTDPSGYSFWTKVRQPLAAVAAMIVVPWAAGQVMAMEFAASMTAAVEAGEISATTAATMTADFAAAAATSPAALMAGGFAAGGISGGNIESAVMGAVQAGLSFGIGEATGTFSGGQDHSASFGTPAYAFNVMAHAALGCGMSVGAGGSCRSGALAGGFSAAAGPVISGLSGDSFYGGLAGRMAAGCVGSYIGKGSCEAGAVTAAFDYLYNAEGGAAPALKGDAYHPDSVAVRQAAAASEYGNPEVFSHPDHNEKLKPGKTPEPSNANSVYKSQGVRVDAKTVIARAEGGTYYRYSVDKGTAHFSAIETEATLQQQGHSKALSTVNRAADMARLRTLTTPVKPGADWRTLPPSQTGSRLGRQ